MWPLILAVLAGAIGVYGFRLLVKKDYRYIEDDPYEAKWRVLAIAILLVTALIIIWRYK